MSTGTDSGEADAAEGDATIGALDGGGSEEAGNDAGPAGPMGLYYIHTDHLGTPQAVTDGSQNVVWSTTYQPYGTTGIVTGSITQNLRLPGQYADSETGFNYNGFRDYMPSMGRYAEADLVGLAGGINPYAYVAESPLLNTDVHGLYDYNSQETQQILDKAYQRATSGLFSGLLHIYEDNAPMGTFDFAGNSMFKKDTFCVNGERLTPFEFGNYAAGYEGAAYDETFSFAPPALLTVYAGGVGLHLAGATVATDDPWDITGGALIRRGALGIPNASGFKLLFGDSQGSGSSCNCN